MVIVLREGEQPLAERKVGASRVSRLSETYVVPNPLPAERTWDVASEAAFEDLSNQLTVSFTSNDTFSYVAFPAANIVRSSFTYPMLVLTRPTDALASDRVIYLAQTSEPLIPEAPNKPIVLRLVRGPCLKQLLRLFAFLVVSIRSQECLRRRSWIVRGT